MNALELHSVSKRFGSTVALRGLSLAVPRGAVCGLIGPNGSGKTTAMGLVGGLLQPDSGSIRVHGERVGRGSAALGSVGLMLQDSLPSQSQSIAAILRHFSLLQDVDPRTEPERVLDAVGLRSKADARFGELSHGMRRRFGVAQALIGRPRLLLLDEPTSGLDPEQVVQIREVIRTCRGDATLVVSSHVLSELEAVCDYYVFMSDGRAVREGVASEVQRATTGVHYRLEREPQLAELHQALAPWALSWNAGELRVEGAAGHSPADVNARVLPLLLAQGLGIVEVRAGGSLEASYLATRRALSD